MRPTRLIALGFGIALVMGIVALRLNVRERSAGAPAQRDVSSNQLCIGAEHVSLEEGIAAQKFDVQLPTTTIAADVVDVCAADGGGLVVKYASGLIIRQSVNDLADPPAAWKDIVDGSPDAGYSLGTIRGNVALLAGLGGPLDLVGGVEWVETTSQGDIKFKLQGNGKIPLDEIVAAAESLTPVDGGPTPSASPSAA
ncbi:MAG: hypothetical protein ABI572_00370 [Actinomycetota bacterium]